jgi:tetratricopeptide (TPR) repeat protein
MRRVWDRKGLVSTELSGATEAARKQIPDAEREVSASPDSRTKLEKLLGLYAVTGQVDRAADLAKRWGERDALDPGALVARAEVAARQGERSKAIRILGGLADVRPGDTATQNWLASLYEAMGERERACSHRIALAGIRASDAASVTGAVRCTRATGQSSLGDLLIGDVAEQSLRTAIERELGKQAPDITKLRGDVLVEASWDADVDLDVALISKSGQRFSWLGDPKGRVTARDATGRRSEAIAVMNAPAGEYVIEITRAEGIDVPVRGELRVQAVGSRRTIPFVLAGKRTEAGSIKVYFTSRLVPLNSW